MTAIVLGGLPRINLMPPSEVARRERARLSRGWVWGVIATALVALMLVAGAFALRWLADQQLAAEQARTNELLIELSSLSEVSQALATQSELSSFRTDSMGGDFAWSPVIAEVAQVVPAEVTLSGFDLVAGGLPQSNDPATEVGLIGTLTLESPTPIDMAATIRAVRAVENVVMADGRILATSLATVGGYQYELVVAFDQTIYSGVYAEQGE